MSKFVIHENNSEQQYWILRLEIEEILKSWVLPKHPLIKEVIERIANSVKNRPIEFLEYEGPLSEENYGWGEVRIMDSGEMNLISKNENKIEFKLFGKKFNGEYLLKKIDYGINPEKNWLWIEVKKEEPKEKMQEDKEENLGEEEFEEGN